MAFNKSNISYFTCDHVTDKLTTHMVYICISISMYPQRIVTYLIFKYCIHIWKRYIRYHIRSTLLNLNMSLSFKKMFQYTDYLHDASFELQTCLYNLKAWNNRPAIYAMLRVENTSIHHKSIRNMNPGDTLMTRLSFCESNLFTSWL